MMLVAEVSRCKPLAPLVFSWPKLNRKTEEHSADDQHDMQVPLAELNSSTVKMQILT
jgi:hypothetical protein